MNILVISHSYEPNADPRALRWTALCTEWAKQGHEVHVVVGRKPNQPRQEKRSGVYIYRSGGYCINALRIWVGRQPTISIANGKLNKNLTYDKMCRALSNVLRATLKLIHNMTWKKIYWPDAYCLWILYAIKRSLFLVKKIKFDAILTVSHPFSSHLVGLVIKKFAPSLLWVADNGDPFSFCNDSPSNNFAFYKRVNYRIESKVLSTVDRFIVTTEQTRDKYFSYFKNVTEEIAVIPPLISDNILQINPKENPNILPKDKINAVFVGTFYNKIRSPKPIIELIAQVIEQSPRLRADLLFHIFGPKDVICNVLDEYPCIKDTVVLHGSVDHVTAVNAMLQASFLINVGNRTDYQLPSKVIEYMATGRPILNIQTIENDTSALYLREYPYHLNWYKGKEEDLQLAIKFFESSPSMTISKDIINKNIDRFCISRISRRYLELMFEALSDARMFNNLD